MRLSRLTYLIFIQIKLEFSTMNVQSIGQTTEEYEHVNQRTGSDIWVPLVFLITLWYTGKVENEYHIW